MALGGPFWRFWWATVLANVGDGVRVAAFPLLAASLTDDPTAVAAVAAASALPWLLTGLLAGSLADRRGARLLLTRRAPSSAGRWPPPGGSTPRSSSAPCSGFRPSRSGGTPPAAGRGCPPDPGRRSTGRDTRSVASRYLSPVAGEESG